VASIAKAAFLSRLRTEEYVVDGRSIPREFVLLEPLVYGHTDGTIHVAPKGFVCDFASIPKILRNVFETNDETRAPAAMHDWLHCAQYTTRAYADDIFKAAMECRHSPWAKRQAMWSGVRAGGWVAWNAKAKTGLVQGYDMVDESYWDPWPSEASGAYHA